MSSFRFGFAKLNTSLHPNVRYYASSTIGGECSVNAAVADPLVAILDSCSQTLSIICDPTLPIASMSLTRSYRCTVFRHYDGWDYRSVSFRRSNHSCQILWCKFQSCWTIAVLNWVIHRNRPSTGRTNDEHLPAAQVWYGQTVCSNIRWSSNHERQVYSKHTTITAVLTARILLLLGACKLQDLAVISLALWTNCSLR